jgi:hypothetical protein
MKSELKDMLEQCMRNKEYGSIAKYWRERYLDAVKRNAPDPEIWQIVDAMRAEVTRVLHPVIPGSSHVYVFADHSAAQLIPGPDGGKVFLCMNYVNIQDEDS